MFSITTLQVRQFDGSQSHGPVSAPFTTQRPAWKALQAPEAGGVPASAVAGAGGSAWAAGGAYGSAGAVAGADGASVAAGRAPALLEPPNRPPRKLFLSGFLTRISDLACPVFVSRANSSSIIDLQSGHSTFLRNHSRPCASSARTAVNSLGSTCRIDPFPQDAHTISTGTSMSDHLPCRAGAGLGLASTCCVRRVFDPDSRDDALGSDHVDCERSPSPQSGSKHRRTRRSCSRSPSGAAR